MCKCNQLFSYNTIKINNFEKVDFIDTLLLIMKNTILIFFLLSQFIFSETYTGYVREIEASFCMDDCSQFYLESEQNGFIDNIVSNNFQLQPYVDRFVSIDLNGEQFCVECTASIVTHIEYSSDCINTVDCFDNPCAVIDCIDGMECEPNYCGGCYGDCIAFNEECMDFTNIDFGECDMVLGVGWTDTGCQYISGCGWDSNGVNYSNYFFSTINECEIECSDDTVDCAENEIEINNLCFNALDIAYIQQMIDNSYQSGIDLGCQDGDNYCGSPNPFMDSADNWGWIAYDGTAFEMPGNENGFVEPLELGIQQWVDGRLTSIMCGVYIYCQLSGEIPPVEQDQLSDIEEFRFEINYLSGYVPESICDLELDDSDYLEFDLTGNLLCPPYPECIEEGVGYQDTTDCIEIQLGDINFDGNVNVLDVVNLIEFILANSNPTDSEFELADINYDNYLNVLDVVALVSIILQN